jgi:hypothetical protein
VKLKKREGIEKINDIIYENEEFKRKTKISMILIALWFSENIHSNL